MSRQLPPWAWSFGFALIVIVLTVIKTGEFSLDVFTSPLSIAPFLVLVGLGQMLVITAGPGNIDVSIWNVIPLSSMVSVLATASSGSWLVGILAGVGVGLAVATVSLAGILFLKIPPIVATLAAGLIASAASLTIARDFEGKGNESVRSFLNATIFDIPWFAIVVVGFTVVVALALSRTVWGRGLLAMGQAQRAAEYAGVRTAPIIATVYYVCGALSGLTGALLASYIAPSINLGSTYLLDSIAVVVIGGTLITGGRAVPAGVWGGAIFFGLLGGYLNLIGWNFAGQNILKGLLVLAVLFLASGGSPGLKRLADSLKPRKEDAMAARATGPSEA